VITCVGAAGYLGYRAHLRRQATGVPMKKYPAALAQIGNNLWEDERPAHEVELAAYSLDVTEVTLGAYQACFATGGCTEPVKGPFCNWAQEERGTDHPINCVNYEQASAYCSWASKRLPTEKEWEHAARSAFDDPVTKRMDLFPWGRGEPNAKLVNACGLECSSYFATRGKAVQRLHDYDDNFPLSAPVGKFKDGETPDGLQDMAGNLWEWTSSPWCVYPDEACGNESEFVIRGGGFKSYQSRTFEATSREALGRKEATETVGFRCANDG